MKGKFVVLGLVVLAVLFVSAAVLAEAQDVGPQGPAAEAGVESIAAIPLSTTFTYQGELRKGGAVFSGTCEMAFRLYDGAGGANLVGSPITRSVAVSNSLFTQALDFGSGVFTGDARWLGILVKCPGDASFTDLGLQTLTAAPQALYALSAGGLQGRAVSSAAPAANQVLKWNGSAWAPAADATGGGGGDITGVYAGAGLSGGGASGEVTLSVVTSTIQQRIVGSCGSGNAIRIVNADGSVTCEPVAGDTGDITGVYAGSGLTGGGVGGEVTLTVSFAGSGSAATAGYSDHNHDGSYWRLTGNAGTNPSTNFLGTTDAVSLTLRVNNTVAFRLEPSSGTPNVVGGYAGNVISTTVEGGTIGGGGLAGYVNRVTANYATVGGGQGNQATGWHATVGGGGGNTASDGGATVGGGYNNQATSYAATVGGGEQNQATSWHATVSGGGSNIASSGATVGGGYSNQATGEDTTVGGGWDNRATAVAATVGGGHHNQAAGYAATVGGGYNITVTGQYATVGGGESNQASGAGAFVGGGGWNGASTSGNTASGNASTIAGGWGNQAIANYAAVGGGYNNQAAAYATIGGGGNNRATSDEATVGGGYNNQATGIFATVGGGYSNQATVDFAVIGGGYQNQAGGGWATVPGGYNNTAAGNYSFAAGRRAKANNWGCFVWGDATDADVTCNNDDRTIFRSSGGYYIYTNPGLTSGMYLSAGGSSWNGVSNRALKENFRLVDTRQLLARLEEIEISTWNYRAQAPSIRHIGPMADDFNGLVDGLGGEGAGYINSLDADGVALAAAQGLYDLSQEQAARIQELEAQNADLEARVVALEADIGSSPTGSAAGIPSGAWIGLGLALVAGALVVQRRRNGSAR